MQPWPRRGTAVGWRAWEGVRKGLGEGKRGWGLGEAGAAAKGRLVFRNTHEQRKDSGEFEPGWRISKARQVLIFFFSLIEKTDYFLIPVLLFKGFPGGSDGKKKKICLPLRKRRFNPWVGKIPWKGNDNPLQCSCLENSMDSRAWWAMVHGVAKCWT